MDDRKASTPPPIAIIGIGCLFPKAYGVEQYWHNIRRGVDAITEVPATHWKPQDYFDGDPARPDMTYARRGGFIDAIDFDPLHFGIAPNKLEATDTTQLLGMVVAEQALRDADYETGKGAGDGRPFNRDRCSVILGVTGTLELVIPLGARLGHPIWRKALKEAGVDEATSNDVVQRIADGYVPWQENSFPGLLGNVAAGRIANRFDLGGTNCVVDAACASSLSAIHLAAMELEAGRSDMVITGGLDTFNDIFMYMCFSKTPALSKTGDARPFSRDGDGTILGEGLGVIILKRLDDALRDGDKIYCVIKGIGSSSDGKGNAIYAPSAAGQIKCLTNAYHNAAVAPDTIELIEAHGTGTKVGDATEVKALTQVLERKGQRQGTQARRHEGSKSQAEGPSGPTDSDAERGTQDTGQTTPTAIGDLQSTIASPSAAIGSVKSMIGHTKAAAGVAGLIKAAMALKHRVLPPTIKVEQPLEDFRGDAAPVYVNTQARPWLPRGDHPRRAGVSAFGFGGSNFHCVLEEWPCSPPFQGGAGGGSSQPNSADHSVSDSTLGRNISLTLPQPLPQREGSQPFAFSGDVQIIALSAATRDELIARLDAFEPTIATALWPELRSAAARLRQEFDPARPCRLIMVAERGRTDLKKLLASARQRLQAEPAADRWSMPDGVWFAAGHPNGTLALLFPGQGSQHVGMLRDLACQSPPMQDALAAADASVALAGGRLSDLIHPIPRFDEAARAADEQALRDTRIAQPALAAVSVGALRLLRHFGLKPDAAAGHSFGELVALHAAGCLDERTLFSLAARRGAAMADVRRDAASGEAGAMLAVVAGIDEVRSLLQSEQLDLVVANHNSPQQVVLSGAAAMIERATTICQRRGWRASRLPVAAAFHSPLVAGAQHAFAASLASAAISPPAIPVYANTNASPYPADAAAIKSLLAAQLAQPVRFVEQIENMAKAGVATFVEVGPRSVLAGLVRSIVGDARATVASLDASAGRRSGEFDLACVLAQLAAAGHPLSLNRWDEGWLQQRMRVATKKASFTVKLSGANYIKPRTARPAASKPAAPPPLPSKDSAGVRVEAAAITSHPISTPQPAPSARREQPSARVTATANIANPATPRQASSLPRATPLNPSNSPPTVPPPAPAAAANAPHLQQALQITQQNILAMQRMQEQTALLHRHYLEGQDNAQRTLHQLVEQQQQILAASLGLAAPAQSPLPSYAPPPLAASRQTPQPPPFIPAAPPPPAPFPAPPTIQTRAMAPTPGAIPAPPPPVATPQAAKPDAAPVLLQVIADKTGYPVEMLDLNMSLDADLGIDSIKRVEILSALQDRLPDAPIVKPEDIGTLQTLRQIVEFLGKGQGNGTHAQAVGPSGPTVTDNRIMAQDAGPINVAPVLLAVVADKTGYPVEMLDLNMSLDADLGIDSIKRVEILSALQDRLPDAPIVKPEDIGTLQTLRQIVEFLGTGKGKGTHVQAAGPSGPTASDPGLSTLDAGLTDAIERRPVTLAALSAEGRRPFEWIQTAPVWISNDQQGAAAALADALRQRGIDAHVVDADITSAPPSPPALAGLILVPPATLDEAGIRRLFALIQRLAPSLKKTADDANQPALLAAITRLGGRFGLDTTEPTAPLTAALAGIVKTARREWPQIEGRVLDAPVDACGLASLAPAIADELLHAGPVEVAIHPAGRRTLQMHPAPLPPATAAPLSPGDVVIITGGARGVTAEVAVALANHYQPTLILLGRSPAPQQDSAWLAELHDEAAMKKAIIAHAPADKRTPRAIEQEYRRILANREVAHTLQRIEAAGANAIYRGVDVRDAAAVAAVVGSLRRDHGPIRGIIHGAGVLADRLIDDKTDEQFEQVFSTKVAGLRSLLSAVDAGELRVLVTFSSTTARLGRRGQVDYAAANEVLNKLAQQFAAAHPACRVLSINWGPWDGGMVTPQLKRVFEEEGVAVIPLRAGAEYLAAEIATPPGGPVEIVIVGKGSRMEEGTRDKGQGIRDKATDADVRPTGTVFNHQSPITNHQSPIASASAPSALGPLSSALSCVFERSISVDAMPVLRSHVIGGKAVLPTAVIIEWLAHAAIHGNPGLVLAGFDDLRILRGVKIEADATVKVQVLAGPAAWRDGDALVPVELRSGATLHARASVALTAQPPQSPPSQRMTLPPLPRPVIDFYDKRDLFHGPALHAIAAVTGCDASGVSGAANPAPPPPQWMREPVRSAWLTDPMVIDAVFQLMIVWSQANRGQGSLPTGVARYRQFQRRFPAAGAMIFARIVRAAEHAAWADVDVVDLAGRLVARLEGCECVIDAALRDAFSRNQLPERVEA